MMSPFARAKFPALRNLTTSGNTLDFAAFFCTQPVTSARRLRGGRLTFQVLVVPVDGQLLRLFAGLHVDSVMRDRRHDDQFLRTFGAIVGFHPMILVVE